MPCQVFVSYSHKDQVWLNELLEFLRPICDGLRCKLWLDKQEIEPGEQWDLEIRKALNSSQIAVMLVSQPLLASTYIRDVELPLLLDLRRKQQVGLFWVPIGPSTYDKTGLKDLQAAVGDPKDPLEGLSAAQRNRLWKELCDKVEAYVRRVGLGKELRDFGYDVVPDKPLAERWKDAEPASPEVFIAYAAEDRDRVRMLVEALRRNGIRVWWDKDILIGQDWEDEIDRAIRRSRKVIVAWSQHSVGSKEVKGEADYARSETKLIPVLLDGAEIPLRYRRIQTLDVSQWTGGDEDGAFRELLDDLRAYGAGTAPPAPATPTAGKVNLRDGLTYVWIQPGLFQMGCSPGDTECDGDEKPPHSVTITKGFWMGQTPVTVGAYKRYSQATGKPMPPEPKYEGRELNPGWKNGEQPIANVNSDEAKAYCDWAGLRLPTEAEWECAARAGSREARYGNLDDIGWYVDNSGRQRIDSTRIWTEDQENYFKRLAGNGNGLKAVGQKLPNAWKLYDMLGNVWEWTADWYGEKYYQAKEGIDPKGPPGGEMRVLRGGSWVNNPRSLRVSVRGKNPPAGRNISFGFRCAGD